MPIAKRLRWSLVALARKLDQNLETPANLPSPHRKWVPTRFFGGD
jgi:hypothetical protein